MVGLSIAMSSSSATALSMPSWRASAALLTASWGTETRRDEFGEVGGGAGQPAGFGEASLVGVEDGVFEAGVGHGFAHAVGEFES